MKLLGKTKKIQVCGKEVTVKKLSLREIVKLFEEIKNLPKEITQLDQAKTEDILKDLPVILATLMPSIANIVVKAVDDKSVTEEFLLDDCGIDDNLEIIKAILEVNNIDKVFFTLGGIKKLARKRK